MRHAAHVAHSSRGRLRIRVASAKGKPEAMEAIRLALQNLPGVKDVEVNQTIGSLTIHYDPNHHANFEQHLASEDCTQDVVRVVSPPKLDDLCEIEGMIEHEAEFLAQHSHVAKTLFDSVDGLDRAFKRATNNAIDFKVVAPLGLAVGAFLGLGIEASTPVWLTLGLFSFNHLIDLHTHPNANSSGNRGQNPPASHLRESSEPKPSHVG